VIISASRRTDIPAFYATWFITRLKEGFVYVQNPMNLKQISNIPLNKEVVDCIVFWTKNAIPLISHLDAINRMGFRYYFLFTLNPYDNSIEKRVGDKKEIIKGFKKLSDTIGKERVIWRYDPVIINNNLSIEYHLRSFYKLSKLLSGYTSKCIFSYVDLYAKIKRRAQEIVGEIGIQNMHKIAYGFSEIAKEWNISLETCSEKIPLSQYGIQHASCIDKRTIEKITGYPLKGTNDKNQRPECGCMESIDIGAYNSCSHGCLYCYANTSDETVYKNIQLHTPSSPLLIGTPRAKNKITDRAVKLLKETQILLL